MMEQTKVADLTVNQLKAVIRETIAETLTEMLQSSDEDLELRDELVRQLQKSLAESEESYKSAQQVAENLGLEW